MPKIKRPIKLTEKNYYTPKNNFLSFSKLKAFWHDKEYFRDLYVTHTKKQEKSTAMFVGQAVDVYIMKGRKAFEKEFVKVARRNLKNPPVGITELSEKDYDMAAAMGEKVRSTPAFEDLKEFTVQPILQVPMPMGVFSGICGIPDWLWVSGDTCEVVDLKTTSDIDSFEKSFIQYGYAGQLCHYTMLVEKIYGASVFTYKILAIEKDTEGIHRCKTFFIEKHIVERERERILKAWEDIAKETDFTNPPVEWHTAWKIGGLWL